MLFLRILLLPISFLYGLIVWVRNKLFDFGVLPSKSFEFPVISIGNITMGGTGKSPHVEYLVRLLKEDYKVATLSRGYGRESNGYLEANSTSTSKDVGDEPLQFWNKFKNIVVAVDEKRVRGVGKCLRAHPDLEVILLDDAFQHRSIVPGLNILLVDYSAIGERQFMLPSGVLREWRRGRKRADIIVVSKSPSVFSPIEARRITTVLKPEPYQKVFYSFIEYFPLEPINETARKLVEEQGKIELSDFKVLLFSGIASSLGLRNHLNRVCKEVVSSEFRDHHQFSMADMLRLTKEFNQIVSTKKILVTTEKDSMRLKEERLSLIIKDYPVFMIPIKVSFHGDDHEFDQVIKDYVRNNKRIR